MITILELITDQDGPLPAPRDKRAGGFQDGNHHIPVSMSVHLCT
jgi:hypothetical protein